MKKVSKTLAFILSAALICAALCGCAAEKPAPERPTAAPVEQAVPVDYRYEAKSLVLSGEGPYLAARACTDDGFYSVDYGVWDDALGDYVTAIYKVGCDGVTERLEGYTPAQPPQEYRSLPEFYSTHELEGFALDKDGNILTVESLYMSWYAGPGERRDEYASMYDAYEYASYVRLLDKNGAELSGARLPLAGDEGGCSRQSGSLPGKRAALLFTGGRGKGQTGPARLCARHIAECKRRYCCRLLSG